jgi:hypothetical protein
MKRNGYRLMILMIQRAGLAIGGIAWWLLCEYLRGKASTKRNASLLGFTGYAGGWLLMFLAAF